MKMSIHQVKYALPLFYRLIDGGYSQWNGLNEEAPTIFKVMLRGTIRKDDF